MCDPTTCDGLKTDPLFDGAVDIVRNGGTPSASHLQRRLFIGYNRASRLLEAMEAEGLVSPPHYLTGKRTATAKLLDGDPE